jgi:hypothetical protein|tara:strand:- start:3270 stop:3686 length:417 start_codon:yes stop_codon:yes gene_type:complete
VFGLGGALRHPLFLVTDLSFFGYISMHIVTTSDLEIKIIPRSMPTANLTVNMVNEETKTSTAITVLVSDYVKTDNDLTFSLSGTFKESEYTTFRVFQSSTEIYRGKVFCTDQTDFAKYTTIENAYTEKESSSNGYLYR